MLVGRMFCVVPLWCFSLWWCSDRRRGGCVEVVQRICDHSGELVDGILQLVFEGEKGHIVGALLELLVGFGKLEKLSVVDTMRRSN